jgi:hypothetical protein
MERQRTLQLSDLISEPHLKLITEAPGAPTMGFPVADDQAKVLSTPLEFFVVISPTVTRVNEAAG